MCGLCLLEWGPSEHLRNSEPCLVVSSLLHSCVPASGTVSSSFQAATQPNAPNLTEVALHHNRLTGNFLSPSQLSLFTSLEVLDLSHNNLTQVRLANRMQLRAVCAALVCDCKIRKSIVLHLAMSVDAPGTNGSSDVWTE